MPSASPGPIPLADQFCSLTMASEARPGSWLWLIVGLETISETILLVLRASPQSLQNTGKSLPFPCPLTSTADCVSPLLVFCLFHFAV